MGRRANVCLVDEQHRSWAMWVGKIDFGKGKRFASDVKGSVGEEGDEENGDLTSKAGAVQVGDAHGSIR